MTYCIINATTNSNCLTKRMEIKTNYIIMDSCNVVEVVML